MLKIVLLASLIGKFSCVQDSTISGVVYDLESKLPLSGSTITYLDNNTSYLSNIEGFFRFEFSSGPVMVKVSHLGYKDTIVTLKKDRINKIGLHSTIYELPEISFDIDDYINNLLMQIINRSKDSSKNTMFSKVFYRHNSSFNGRALTLLEMNSIMSHNTYGITRWQPLNSRVVSADSNRVVFLNFLSFALHNSGKIDPYNYCPLNKFGIGKEYDFEFVNFFKTNRDQEMVKIKCSPKKKNDRSIYFEGYLYVSTNEADLIKVEGEYYFNISKEEKRSLVIQKSFSNSSHSQKPFIHLTLTTKYKKKSKGTSVQDAWLFFLRDENGFINNSNVYSLKERDEYKILKQNSKVTESWDVLTPIERSIVEKSLVNSGFKENWK